MKRQFFQSLYDNFEQRFPSDDFLQAASCLNPLMWPKDPLKSALHGDKSVSQLCKCLGIPSDEAAVVLCEYAVFKQSSGAVVGKSLQQLIQLSEVLPIFPLLNVRGDSVK